MSKLAIRRRVWRRLVDRHVVPKGRRRWLRQQRAAGTRQRLDELMTSFGVLQQTLRSREPGSQRAAMAKN